MLKTALLDYLDHFSEIEVYLWVVIACYASPYHILFMPIPIASFSVSRMIIQIQAVALIRI